MDERERRLIRALALLTEHYFGQADQTVWSQGFSCGEEAVEALMDYQLLRSVKGLLISEWTTAGLATLRGEATASAAVGVAPSTKRERKALKALVSMTYQFLGERDCLVFVDEGRARVAKRAGASLVEYGLMSEEAGCTTGSWTEAGLNVWRSTP